MAETVADQLRLSIISGDLPPGARMRQEELAERLAVSRGPVRQALIILEREGLVRTDRWRGAIVAPLDVPLIKDLYEFRGAVERFVVEALAKRETFNPAPLRALVESGRAAAAAGDLARLVDLDLRFHVRLYEDLGNRVLTDVMSSHWTHTRRVMAATLRLSGYSQTAWDEHGAIVDAIEAHDAQLAGERAAAHMAAASARMVDIFTRGIDQAPAPTESPRTDRRRTREAGRRHR